jgi:hypothetical protein
MRAWHTILYSLLHKSMTQILKVFTGKIRSFLTYEKKLTAAVPCGSLKLKEGICRRRTRVPEEFIPEVEHCLLEPDVGGLFAAKEAAPPETRVVERLQEVTALQDTGDDATP